MKAALLCAAMFSGACGASAQEVRRSQTVAYDTEFAQVWNVVVTLVREDYPRLVDEDAVKGRLKTDWHLVERMKKDDLASADQGQVGGRFFHMLVEITGGPPWQVSIKGEGAEYRPGMAMVTPFKRGGADEPGWVPARIENMYLKIYRRLRAHAVEIKQPPSESDPGGAVDAVARMGQHGWASLGAECAALVAEVHDSASRRDAAALRPRMIHEFAWSATAEPSADVAVALWSADPGALDVLARTLERGCQLDGPEVARCGDEAGKDRAEFRRTDGVWRFSAFWRGDRG